MKVSLNTVKQFTSVDVPVDELVQKINQQLGGVEDITDLADKYKDAVIVQVLSAVKHENADKLSVCIIDDGGVVKDVERDGDGHVQVVCGAPNVRADMLAVWLPPKATVPATYNDAKPFVLDAREIRGVKSNGMLAAPDELAIGGEHAGILELNPDEWRPYDTPIQPGASFAAAYGLDDTVIDIENKMFTHRPDCFGQLGVAREISAILKGIPTKDEDVAGTRFENPDWYWMVPQFATASSVELQVFNDAPEKAPRFMAVVMDNVTIQPSPLWLQCALVAMGSKPINNVVDLTNYIMLLTAQPTHAYDYDKIRGAKLGVRMAQQGETVKLLNDKTYTLTADDIIIADAEGPVGLAGVMGGGDSEVDRQTTRIVLEVASFDMYAVRKTSMRYGLFTDALTRFNKGQSPLQNDRVIARLMELAANNAGAKQASNVFDLPDRSGKLDEVSLSGEISISVDFINTRLGTDLEALQIGGLLRRVNFASYAKEGDENTLIVTAPFWRTDIILPEDIVEEVGRLYGFDKLPRVLPERSIKPAPKNPRIELKKQVRRILAGAGANEVLTYSFVHERTLQGAGQDASQAFRLGNALSPDLQYYRLTLTPSLLSHVHANIKAGHDTFALFEIGKGHSKGQLGEDSLPAEFEYIAAVLADKKATGAAYYQAKRLLEMLLDGLCVRGAVSYQPVDADEATKKDAYFAPGRAAVVLVDGTPIGRVGEYTIATQKAFKLPSFSAGFELDLAALQALPRSRSYVPLPRFPHVTQDISLKVPMSVSYGDLHETVSPALEAVRPAETSAELTPLGIYQPEGSDTKTITLRLRIASYERTLTDAEVTGYLDSMAAAAATTQGAVKV